MSPKFIPVPDDWRAAYQDEWNAYLKWLFISAAILASVPILGFFLQAVAPDWDFLAFLPVPFWVASLALAFRGWLRLARKQVLVAKALDVSRGRGPLIRFVNERPILASAIAIAAVLLAVFALNGR
jgi:hypothetical protein